MNVQSEPNSYRSGPDPEGMFGIFGGRFVAETLMPLILDLEQHWNAVKADKAFQDELAYLNKHYTGRPSPLYFAERLTEHLGGAKIYFKRDELNHTGSHKINNCLGQILLAKRMGKKRIIAETGAGQHGVASATVAARFGYPCIVYMGATDIERQAPNVFRMKLLGAEVVPVTSGSGTLKDAMNEALRDWVTNVEDTYYIIGTAAGPHPYPELVRDFQSVIGRETKEQIMEAEGRLPDLLVAAVGGGSNAIGLFHPFLDDRDVRIVGVEAGGKGLEGEEHCASLTAGQPGVLHGNRTYLLQNPDGQIMEGHSISAGLDYPGIGPEHSWLKETGRVDYVPIVDTEALEAFQLLTRLEGIIPALEPSHALAEVIRRAPNMNKDQIIVMNLCGRGDKDVLLSASILAWNSEGLAMHVNPSREQFKAIFGLPLDMPVNMLNLLRFRDEAAYAEGDPEAGDTPVSGLTAYSRYSRDAAPIFDRVGGSQLWIGKPELMLIGPETEGWDLAFVARYPTAEAFVTMVKDADYQRAVRHRSAAVADSRLIRCAEARTGRTFIPGT